MFRLFCQFPKARLIF